MAVTDYLDAQKLGKKEYRSAISKGEYPYLPVLDDILKHVKIDSEVELGLLDIPLDRVVGTSTAGRTEAFARNFMPLLDHGSEFSSKWSNLADAQVEEGIRDPIKVYEYLNRFYVVEGNKRVSVLKYYGAVTISAEVIRKVPEKNESLENKIYYEFMDFFEVAGINTLYVSKLGEFSKMLDLTGGKEEPWTDEKRKEFNAVFFMFRKEFKKMGGDKLPINSGDAFIPVLSIYGYDKVKEMTPSSMKEALGKIWNELVLQTEDDQVDILMDPAADKDNAGKKLLHYLLPWNDKQYKVVFVYDKEPGSSDWIYSHELGRIYVEELFGDELITDKLVINDLSKAEQMLTAEVLSGADIIFTVTPKLLDASLKVAVEYPDVKILNCSLNTPHRYVRTYHARMYEAKFLTGMIAGAMTENDKIGYIADNPIFGTTANINAFALGAKFTNPRAKVYLNWTTAKDYDYGASFAKEDIRYLSGQDFITPDSGSREFGLYYRGELGIVNMVMPVWHWGIFYELMIKSVLSGSFKRDWMESEKAYNYWWGMSAGVIDLIISREVPSELRTLVEYLKKSITGDSILMLDCEIKDQDGNIRNDIHGPSLTAEDLTKMDWLVDNVIGDIPKLSELEDSVKEVIEFAGVSKDEGDE
ncbi:MAG: BMP family ABC transporter substrate-binding protein [Lachnospiraceae bacterium]|nr:BMP family ABC transporter substrate-binding protein [Lachnospiraceae bacterium]